MYNIYQNKLQNYFLLYTVICFLCFCNSSENGSEGVAAVDDDDYAVVAATASDDKYGEDNNNIDVSVDDLTVVVVVVDDEDDDTDHVMFVYVKEEVNNSWYICIPWRLSYKFWQWVFTYYSLGIM